MKAMILAAGVGSRLRPLTDSTPKALVEVDGVPMLERVARRLIAAGVDGLIVNAHHLAEQVEAFIKSRKGFGIRCEISKEPVLLDTGGGLKKASWFFDDGKPFFLHNVDVVTELDLPAMYRAHDGLATLAVRERETTRALHFDGDILVPPGAGGKPLAFDGVHVISPAIFPKLTEDGVFSIIRAYWRLAEAGEAIRAFRSDPYEWHDIGSAAKLDKARRRRDS
jgi:NDP-sugar pyrophosphorylase family protein